MPKCLFYIYSPKNLGLVLLTPMALKSERSVLKHGRIGIGTKNTKQYYLGSNNSYSLGQLRALHRHSSTLLPMYLILLQACLCLKILIWDPHTQIFNYQK